MGLGEEREGKKQGHALATQAKPLHQHLRPLSARKRLHSASLSPACESTGLDAEAGLRGNNRTTHAFVLLSEKGYGGDGIMDHFRLKTELRLLGSDPINSRAIQRN